MSIIETFKSILVNPPEDEAERKSIVEGAQALIAALQPLHDQSQSLLYSNVTLPILGLAADLKIIQLLAAEPEKQFTTEELASTTKCQDRILVRVMRYLATKRIVAQTASNQWKATPLTKELASSGNINGIYHQLYNAGPAYQATPAFFKSQNYHEPADPLDCPFRYVNGAVAFEWTIARPANREYFTEFAKVHRGSKHWLDTELAETLTSLGQECGDTSPLFVDIGGSVGQRCLEIRERLPGLKGRVINQDMPSTVEAGIQNPGIEHQGYDFFTPQPIEGSRVYYMSNIMHDSADEKCVEILSQIPPAMSADSELWIDEAVVPDIGANEFQTNQDMTMLAAINGKERTFDDWKNLLQSAGLVLKKRVLVDAEISREVLIAGPV